MLVSPSTVAERYRAEIKHEVRALGTHLKVVGFLSGDYGPSLTYAQYTRKACEDLGIDYELRTVPRLELEQAIQEANADDSVHGIMVYYPIFDNEQDRYLKDVVDHRKDIEGLNSFWIRKLYQNERIVDGAAAAGKAVVPCTALAILKILEANGAYGASGTRPVEHKTVTIFNRSEVVGRPLAVMMSNDGARVYSFDEHGPLLYEGGRACETPITRSEALEASDLVITGVPAKTFPKIGADEISSRAICLNFATIKNFAPQAEEKAGLFIPRVGPVTVAMCMRNTLRLHRTYFAR
ncbi:MAG: bifunctional methylenetetrahydrofolate dehydrogenase/methenyltetrahydrofolate cyclohydrolase [Desulfuromonadales bacterium]|nr:bifunctional methylenetetrahydrofolate dehydrogenase/methenyltetrahydrofolate cyclohydrolase [Desulfuromonadales bacterium]NIR33951.1 bifunctional methylenetetrahydrofolate dehydrogenase/methenyltetrahydrofolate cyclohydrolase [Desulfuromonadales bacterium]NIS42638.1 bifunctional methylenetetrahydrofolate dehydrogenase/methenyltetrahydrofolate cyclohydrolase [Desulfuromonadales bacterium]